MAAIINIGAKGAKQLLELAEHGHKGIKAMTMKGAMTIPAFAARFDGMLIVGIEISVQGLNLTSKIHLRELGKVLAANLNKPVADTGKTGMVIRAEQLLKGKHITPAEAEAAKGVTITCLQLEAISTIGGNDYLPAARGRIDYRRNWRGKHEQHKEPLHPDAGVC